MTSREMRKIRYRDLRQPKYQIKQPALFHTMVKGFKVSLHDAKGRTVIFLNGAGHLWIMDGYTWDGSSGPTWDTKSTMRASLMHDALYQLMREGLLPEYVQERADKEYRRYLIQDGVYRLRAWAHYAGLYVFGWQSSKKTTAADRQKHEDMIAP